MQQGPVAIIAHGNADGFHSSVTAASPVAGTQVDVKTPEAMGAMISMLGAGSFPGHGAAAVTAKKGVGRRHGAAPTAHVGSGSHWNCPVSCRCLDKATRLRTAEEADRIGGRLHGPQPERSRDGGFVTRWVGRPKTDGTGRRKSSAEKPELDAYAAPTLAPLSTTNTDMQNLYGMVLKTAALYFM